MIALKGKAAIKMRMQWKTYQWRTIQEACKAKNEFQVCYQCSRGVRRLHGVRGKEQLGGAPMLELEFFRKQMYCIEESTFDTVEIFDAPRSDSATP